MCFTQTKLVTSEIPTRQHAEAPRQVRRGGPQEHRGVGRRHRRWAARRFRSSDMRRIMTWPLRSIPSPRCMTSRARADPPGCGLASARLVRALRRRWSRASAPRASGCAASRRRTRADCLATRDIRVAPGNDLVLRLADSAPFRAAVPTPCRARPPATLGLAVLAALAARCDGSQFPTFKLGRLPIYHRPSTRWRRRSASSMKQRPARASARAVQVSPMDVGGDNDS